MRLLGPVRNRWEGGFRGEGFLRVVKPMVFGMKRNWEYNLLLNLLRQKSLLQMKKGATVVDMENAEDDEDIYQADVEQLGYRRYRSHTEFITLYTAHQVMSCCILVGNADFLVTCYCCVQFGNDEYAFEFRPNLNTHEYHFGMNYFSLEQVGEQLEWLELGSLTADALLLPLGTTYAGNKYTLITNDWKTWNSNGKACFPHEYLLETEFKSWLAPDSEGRE